MNQTIIQERSSLNQFYAKVYAFVGIGIGLSALGVSFDVDSLSAQLTYFLMHWPSLVDDCNFCRTCSSLCCK